MFSREERERAVELYFTTSMSTKQVVEHLGYPTRQCLERWLRDDPRYADAVPKPPIPLGARRRAVGLCLSGMQRKQAAAEPGAGAGDRSGGTPCLRPEPSTDCWAMTRMCCVGGYGSWSRGNALMWEAVRGREKRPGRRPAAPVGQGEDDAGRPAEAEVFAEVDGFLAAVSRPAATAAATRERGSISTGPCAAASRTCSANRGAGTGIDGSRRRWAPGRRRR